MTLATPVGAYAAALDHLRAAFGDSTAWQAWCGAASEADALEHVYITAVPPPEHGGTYEVEQVAALLPMAILEHHPFVTAPDSAYGGTAYRRGGTIVVELAAEADPATAHDPGQVGRLFANQLDALIADMEAMNGMAGYLAWNALQIEEAPERGKTAELPTKGDLIRVTLKFTWSGQ